MFNFKSFFEYLKKNDQQVFLEGLEQTYPVSFLKKNLGYSMKKLGIKKIQEYQTFDGIPIGLTLTVPIQTHLTEIKQILNTFGYYIGLSRGEILQVEPKYPFKIDTKDLPKVAYHVTSSLRTKKILEKGLTPRDSETFFNHPGSRIYLFIPETLEDLEELKEVLASAKNTNPKNLTLFEVELKEPFYYIDTNLFKGVLSESSFGIFTSQNISPSFLKVYN